jgi:hypothetical protein
MKIDHYEFGRLVVGGQEFHHDLIIFYDRVRPQWWRVEGHRLQVIDLEDVWQEKAEFLIIGTGAYGAMKVEKEVKEKALQVGFQLIVQPTREAVKTYNQIEAQSKAIGAFHLTC